MRRLSLSGAIALLSLASGLSFADEVRGQSCPERASWPTAAWPERPADRIPSKADAIKALEDHAFTLTGRDEERLGVRTNSVLIVKGGVLVYERYARGYGPDNRHFTFSVSKSITNALVGVAVERGALRLEDSICDHLPTLPEDKCLIRVVDLLEFGSGLDWGEINENGASNQASSTLALFFGQGRADMTGFIASHPQRVAPGEEYAYSTADLTLVMAVVQGALAPEHGETFPWTLLFDRIGMQRTTWQRDGKGVLIGGAYVFATPRDLARFGYLFLNDGCWDGQRLLPEGWVAESTTPSLTYRRKHRTLGASSVAGRAWWLNREVAERSVEKPWPSAPSDTYCALGLWGQMTCVIPSRDLVIVRTGDDREDGAGIDRDVFLPLAIAVAEDLP